MAWRTKKQKEKRKGCSFFFEKGGEGRGGGAMRQQRFPGVLLLALSASSALLGVLAADLNKGDLS